MRYGGDTLPIEFIFLRRQWTNEVCTIGRMAAFGHFFWTLEDPRREHKVYGETRIPAGRYDIKLRTEGGMTQRYAQRFPDMHKGMLWLQEVPMFEWVYIHIGNTAADTEGCILVGMERSGNTISRSKVAYCLLYPLVVATLGFGRCILEITDERA